MVFCAFDAFFVIILKICVVGFGARSLKMVEAFYNKQECLIPEVEIKFGHINGNGSSYGPPYECQLESLLA
ncbi:hypothetical protein MKW98_029506 [Papaver atlanticum]|uniref:Uncharacterized protein n=1 Tax=Papaver atlanticum TaxID=357466 RepID=A0AAD4SHI2_9MAGN|nr:hypothetical protein MKW98_029506 [Papaver atlanticum]